MRIDDIAKPDFLWFEDDDGNKLELGPNIVEFPPEYKSGDARLIVQSTRTTYEMHCKQRKDLWPVKFLNWIIKILPKTWRATDSQIFAGSSPVNIPFSIMKHLVEKRKFSIEESLIATSEMCGRCIRILDLEATGADLNADPGYMNKSYDSCRVCCSHCEVIDPEYSRSYTRWVCYRTMKLGGDVAKAYKERFPNSNAEYMKKNGISY